MGLKSIFGLENKKKKATPADQNKPKETGLCDILKEGIQLKEESKQQLIQNVTKGVEFFKNFNEARIHQAYESFDESMRYALYEIIYLLHVNEPSLEEIEYKSFHSGKSKRDTSERKANLYVKDAPFGVKEIANLSPVFLDDFKNYIQKTFDKTVSPAISDDAPIEGIYSIGSIGTIGHKNVASDLDLEVQYNLQSVSLKASDWTDELLKETFLKEHDLLTQRYYQKKGIESENAISPGQKKKIHDFFMERLKQKYPILLDGIITKKTNLVKEIIQNNKQKLRYQLILETINLMKRGAIVNKKDEIEKKEELLKQRIKKIQDYIQSKFPEAEVYLFPFSRQDLIRGRFGSTLDSKESSGSAYELILNYETLMPGIYFTPVIPTHFLFTQEINNNDKQFERFSDFLQFGLLDVGEDLSNQLNHQGATPDLSVRYVAMHNGAAYWEAFKASSGNLPKAALNLFRYEMLLEDRLAKTNIQMIKAPGILDEFVETPAEIDEYGAEKKNDLFLPSQVLALEAEFTKLKFDPWWLRYKALKIAFGASHMIRGVSGEEAEKISRIIDFSFALHIRLSDVFLKPGESKDFKRYRETVLFKFYSIVFPEGSERRNELKAIFIGDVDTVRGFEKDLRELFLNSVERIRQKVNEIGIQQDEKTTQEYEIWYHHFLRSFKPRKNVVQKSILNHLQVPRGRLQIGFRQNKGWFFRSLQRGTTVGKRFESSVINLLPEEITLIENTGFLKGLVYCVINGYYGVFNKGMLNEHKTELEYDRKHSDLGSKYNNYLAFIRPDQIENIMKQILVLFADKYVSYLDCIQTDYKINEVMIFLNMLEYGSISVLYRDNLKTIFAEQFSIPKFTVHVDSYISSYKKMFQNKNLHIILFKFFKSKNIDPRKVNLCTWVNANSVETAHSITKANIKEKELSQQFHESILKIHSSILKKYTIPPK